MGWHGPRTPRTNIDVHVVQNSDTTNTFTKFDFLKANFVKMRKYTYGNIISIDFV